MEIVHRCPLLIQQRAFGMFAMIIKDKGCWKLVFGMPIPVKVEISYCPFCGKLLTNR